MLLIIISAILIKESATQWRLKLSMLSADAIFTEYEGLNASKYSNSFANYDSNNRTANFITCTNPATSYITLSSIYPQIKYYEVYNNCYGNNPCWVKQQSINYFKGEFVSFDLYFRGTWSNEMVNFTLGTFTFSQQYTSLSDYSLINQFCDEIPYDIKSVNFTLNSSIVSDLIFSSSNLGDGEVSIRNIYVLNYNLICYPTCKTCKGNKYNHCLTCFYGAVQDGVCQSCPQPQYLIRSAGCALIPKCYFIQPLCYNEICYYCTVSTFFNNQIQALTEATNPDYLRWTILYDPQAIDSSLGIQIHQSNYFYGIFKFRTGITRFITGITPTLGYYLGIKIVLLLFNEIPIDCGIHFKFNNTYYGSIYRNGSGIQLHKFKDYSTSPLVTFPSYQSTLEYSIYGYFDVPMYPLLFTAIANYTYITQYYSSDSASGWGMKAIQFFTNYCASYCQECDVTFKCKKCNTGYVLYRDGTCISSCAFKLYQKVILVGSQNYCKDFDDQTLYSKILIEELIDQFDVSQYPQYDLISQTGTNFLKGPDIYYSFWNGFPIFGGRFVWAQAKFSRVHEILNPHHSISIGFQILYGPNFPSDGQFIFTIESNAPLIKSASALVRKSDGTKTDTITIENVAHSQNSLTVYLECFGANNEPISSYCGFYSYTVVVHYCQPYCLQCLDQQTCLNWDSAYNSNLIKFSQAECQSNEYYEFRSFSCQPCSESCLVCSSIINCTTCKPTYTNTKLGCFCKQNQYEQANQCFDCPIECTQCLSSDYCTECYKNNNRKLSNGQCVCLDGYYPINSDPKCLTCDKFCEACYGPTVNDCISCNSNISNIELAGSTCQCSSGYFYENTINQCVKCHETCQTCFDETISGCLTCNSQLNRFIKGLKCECLSGSYEYNNLCISCPIQEDINLSNCYKYCDSLLVWHTNTCNQCQQGFELVENECLPICGDLLIRGYEQCEDGNNELDDLCFNCKFQCPINCESCDEQTTLPCSDICGDMKITGNEECEDGNDIQYDGCHNCKYQCQPECTKCVKGKCQECATKGWQIDPTTEPWKCKEVCGDQIVVGIEQCDDGNFNDQDGCKNCKYFCRIGCTQCNYNTNTCLSCEYHGFRPESYYCFPIENDGILVIDPYGYVNEICDSSYNSGYYYYSHFQYCVQSNIYGQLKCQPAQICSSCVSSRCVGCASGQELVNNICQPKCGDSKKVDNEHCEDSFILPYKGCQNCQPKCQTSCQNCDKKGSGCLACQTGYQRIENLCYSICGDKLITADEECDDGNLVQGDGCHFCQFSCQESCLNCIKGKCLNCQEGYLLIQSRCYPICDDEIKNQPKECEVFHFNQYCDENCEICNFGICQQCKDDYEISIHQNQCIQSFVINTNLELCHRIVEKNIENYQIYKQYNFEKVELYCDPSLAKNEECNQQFQFCVNCNIFQCLECQYGYYLNQQFLCISMCGDGILSNNEECEIHDVNCINCLFQKPQFCLHFYQNTCLECDYGFNFNKMTNSCQSQCGDGVITKDEECEDQINCQNCKLKCSDECMICQEGICIICSKTYILTEGKCYPGEQIVKYPSQIQNCSFCLEFEYQFLQDNIDLCVDQCIYNQQYYLTEQLITKNLDETFNDEEFNLMQIIECGNGIVEEFEQCDDQNLINEDQCNNLCEFACFPNCEFCIKGFCCKCEIGWQLSKVGCEPICGDSLIVGDEECDDGNIDNYDGCFRCQYSCTQNCLICNKGICIQCNSEYQLDEHNKCKAIYSQVKFYEQKDCKQTLNNQCIFCLYGYLEPITSVCIVDLKLNNYCSKNCKSCQIDKCLECQKGYYGNACNSQVEITDLFSIQQIIEIYDQLDSNYQCCSNCLYCVQGICYLCNNGHYLFNNQCISSKFSLIKFVNNYSNNCGDGILQAYEQCDDQNNIDFDSCFNCQHSCDINCYQCMLGICQMCQTGYILNSESQCDPDCGDGLVIPMSSEQCDDGNLLEEDGCYNCKIECKQNCLYCDQIQHCLKCARGFSIKDDFCVPICGDGIVLSNYEECDDANYDPFDGCYECKYQCNQSCLVCNQGICEVEDCNLGFQWVKDSCQPICGDNLIVNNEECDDGNFQEFDGCFNCQYSCIQNCQVCEKGVCQKCNYGFRLSDNQCQNLKDQKNYEDYELIMENDKDAWICHNLECSYSLAPKMIGVFLNQTFSKQYVQVNFDQDVKLDDTTDNIQSDLFKFSLKNQKEDSYRIYVQSIVDISFDIRSVIYQLEIDNLIYYNEKPILIIQLLKGVSNFNNQTVSNVMIQLPLKVPLVLSEENRQTSQQVMATNKILMIGAISFSVISLISGESSFFVEILDVLQYQSYLKFINLDYPENLVIYFSASDILSISQYIDILQIDQLFHFITRKDQNANIDGKFKFYNVETDFFSNILPQVIQVCALVAIMLLGNKFYQLFRYMFFSRKIFDYLQFKPSNIKQYIIKALDYYRIWAKKLICMEYLFNLDYARPFIAINAWDMLFKIIISLRYNFDGGTRSFIQILINLVFLSFYLHVILEYLIIHQKSIKQIIFENQFQSFDIGRKLIFHLILVNFQECPILQSLLISITSFLQCIIICKYQKVKIIEKMISLIIEGTISLFTLTTFIYFSINRRYFSNEQIIEAGFIHMSLLLSSLIIIFFKQLILKLNQIISKIIKKQERKEISNKLIIFI